ncbi:MAG: UPF0058 family protein [Methanimicrococcus sp.]|nr:UPF0058 family protein [Methanimicrococcus sp.]
MKNNFEMMGYKNEFNEYQELLISPTHVHKSKNEHEKAIFILSSKLSSLVAEQKEVYKIKYKDELEKQDEWKQKMKTKNEKQKMKKNERKNS